MTNRREFLQISTAVSALPVIGSARASNQKGSAPATSLDFYRVVYDQRYAASSGFADYFRQLDVPVHGMENGDITGFWVNDLHQAWQQSPVPLAGLTEYGPLFCLEEFARQYRLRVVFKARHQFNKEGFMQHQLEGPAQMLERASAALISRDNWSTCMASLLDECPIGQTEISSGTVSTRAGSADENERELYSWILAPARKVSQEGMA